MLNKMKIQAKLLIGFAIVGLIVAAVGLYSIKNINAIAKADKAMYETVAVPLGYAADINYLTQAIRINYYQAAVSYDSLSQANAFLANISNNVDELDEVMDAYEGTIIDDVDRKNWLSMQDAIEEYTATEADYRKVIASGDHAAIKEFVYVDMKDVVGNLADARQEMIDYMIVSGGGMQKTNTELASTTSKAMVAIIIFAVIIAMLFGTIISSNIQNIIKSVINQTRKLVDAAVGGNLDVRANAEEINFEFRGIVTGINETLDAVINPLNVAAEYVDRISKGDIPAKITDNYNGDFNEIKNNLNGCIDAVNLLVTDAKMLSEAAAAGQLDVRADASRHQGDFHVVVQGVNDTLDNVINPLNVAAEYVDRISKGDIPAKITDNYNGDFNEIKNNLNICIDAVNELAKDALMLSESATEGNFSARVDASKHKGDYYKIVQGMNDTLDVVVAKIFWYEQILDSIQFPISVTDMNMNWTFFNKAAETVTGRTRSEMIGKQCSNWNADICNTDKCGIALLKRGTLQSFFEQPGMDKNFQVDTSYLLDENGKQIGHIEVIQDVTKAEKVREYNKVEVQRLAQNLVKLSKGNLDFDLNVAVPDEYTEAEHQNFSLINENMSQVQSAINLLISDSNILVDAAVEGKLDTRADASKHNGEFAKIVEGVNKTLDAVINPLNVAAEYVDRISKGDIPAKISDNYNGDFNEIKNNLNMCIDAVNLLVSDSKMLTNAAEDGQLDVRADASKHMGDFRAVVQGVNDTLDNVINPLNVAAEYVDRISKGDIPAKITDNYNGDFNEIKNNLNMCIDAVNLLVDDAKMLANAAVVGRLNTRADATQHQGDFRAVVDGVNNTISTLVGLLDNMPAPAMIIDKEFNIQYMNETGAKLDNKSGKDLVGTKCYDHFRTKDCRTSNCACGKTMSSGINEARSTQANPGNLNLEIDYSAVPVKDNSGNIIGAFEVVNDQTAARTAMKKAEKVNIYQQAEANKLTEALDMFAKGNLSFTLATEEADEDTKEAKTIFDTINQAVLSTSSSVNELVEDAGTLAQAAVEGKLDVRADASKHQGEFRNIVEGVNNTLDAVINPLNVAAEYVDRISKGDVPAKITDNYNGDFNEIKNNLNLCIDSLNGLIDEMNHMSKEHDLGDIDVQIDAAKFEGAFHKMAQGVNDMVNGHITVKKKAMACVKEFGEGNFDAELEQFPGKKAFINEIVEKVRENIKGLITDMNHMSQQHDLGDIDIVIPAENYKGDFHIMAQGVNDMVFGHIAVKKKAMACVKEFGEGNFEAELEKFPGKKAFINETVEQVRKNLKSLIADTNVLVDAAVEGRLEVRADATKHDGDFRKIVQGVNDTLDAVINPLNVAADYINRISVGDMPELITDTYHGDFNTIKNNLNKLVEAINDITNKAKMVADGNLTVNLQKRSAKDDLMASLNDMVQSTAKIIAEFNAASENISAASQEMSSTSQQISQGATEQASSAEEVSSSMEEMLANIQQNTDNAQQTEKIALNASEGIEKVNKASAETLKFMQEIADKIGIIGEISRETNILALNAAVEAARAGEHGKGFAVVAAEVRKLAERSQVSAVEIDDLTKNSVKATEESTKLLEDIAPEIGKTAKLVQEITAASMEQSSGADQINNAIQQLNQVTQQNAAASEEMATTSEEQAGQSEQLLDMIAFFKLNDDKRSKGKKKAPRVSNAGTSAGSNGQHRPSTPSPKSQNSEKNSGVVIDMGKDNMDNNYETF